MIGFSYYCLCFEKILMFQTKKMSVELCSDNSGMSPRISFSLDLCHFDDVPIEQRPLRSKPSSSNPSIDFDFNVGTESFQQQQQSSSADELFSDGKIIPAEIKTRLDSEFNRDPMWLSDTEGRSRTIEKNNIPSKPTHQSLTPSPPPPLPPPSSSSKEDDKQSGSSKSSFWGFKRSRSFSCGSGYGRSLCPLPLLSRSNSTGSTPNIKQPSSSNPKHVNSHKHASSTSYHHHHHHKPPLKKNAYKPYGTTTTTTVHVNPVLNVPSGNLFGLGSIFFNGSKAKNHCKKK